MLLELTVRLIGSNGFKALFDLLSISGGRVMAIMIPVVSSVKARMIAVTMASCRRFCLSENE